MGKLALRMLPTGDLELLVRALRALEPASEAESVRGVELLGKLNAYLEGGFKDPGLQLAKGLLEWNRKWPTTAADQDCIIQSRDWLRWVKLARAVLP